MGFVAEDLKTILSTYTYAFFTHGTVTGTFQRWEVVTGGVSLATGIIVELNSGTMMIYVTSGIFGSTEVITGSDSSAFTTLSAIDLSVPSIRLSYENHPSSHSSDGEIVIEEENNNNIDNMVTRKNKSFSITTTVSYDAQTDSIMLNRLIRQIEYSLDSENRINRASRIISTKDYYWNFGYIWNGDVRLGFVTLIIRTDQRWILI